MSRRSRTLVWFRGKDLRIADHEPLTRAAADGEVIPVFVFDPYFFHPQRARKLPHRMQFLLESVNELSESLASLGSKLICLPGRSSSVIPEIVEAWNVSRVVAHRWVEPWGRGRDARIAKDQTVAFDLLEW
ncbi:MAG: deoxyribodipyrimidine photo-lyase, partial [Verrucomicrobiota bacterium]|nr:deoxyribodipyrimidine photo-lyase [Verrucomicrobiota bacterium]